MGVQRGEKRREAWVWTAVVEEEDGRRRVDFEVGDRSEAAFLKLYDRLPEARRFSRQRTTKSQLCLPGL